MQDAIIYCTGCGNPNVERTTFFPHCGTKRELNRRERASGIAFLLNELQAPPVTAIVTPGQRAQLAALYGDELSGLRVVAPRAAPKPAPARAARQTAAPARPAQPPSRPRDWSWLAEQQANLFLFAGAFLTVVAALIYVGYSGQAVSGALKMSLLAGYTLAFLAAGVACMRIPRVSMAGQVFFGVGAILVPMNFVAARSVLAGADLDATSMWLAGSIVTAAFYAAVAYAGVGRMYAFGGGVAAISAAVAATVITDMPAEWTPAALIAAATAMSLTDVAGPKTLRDRIGVVWAPQSYLLAAAAMLLAVVIAPFASDGSGEGTLGVATRWSLPAAFTLFACYAAIPAVVRRRQSDGLVTIAAASGTFVSSFYALGLPAEWYVIAFGALAALLGTASVALPARLAPRLPDGFRDALEGAGIAATGLAAVSAWFVATAVVNDGVVAHHARWSLAPASALVLAFYVLEAFALRRRLGVFAASLAVAALCASIVFGIDASAEYYAFALIAPAIALSASSRWIRHRALGRLPGTWRSDLEGIDIALTVAGLAVATGAAIVGAAGDGGYRPQSGAFLPVAFAAAALSFSIEASRARRSDLTAAALAAGCGAIASIVYALHGAAEWYGVAFAASAVLIAIGSRTWSPSWLDRAAADAVAAVAITTAWLPFEGAYAHATRAGAGVHLAAAFFYAGAALGIGGQTPLDERLEAAGLPSGRLAVACLYAAGVTTAVGYIFLLRSLPSGGQAGSDALALPLMGLALAAVVAGATARRWRPDFRLHFYVMSLAVATGSIVATRATGTLAALVTVYAVVYAAAAVWEGMPGIATPSLVFAFAAVPVWRAHLDAPLSTLPVAYMLLGVAAFVAARAAAVTRRPRWTVPLRVAAAAFAVAAPSVGFSLLAAHTHAGLVDGVRFERTPLYRWSTLSLAIVGVLAVADALFDRRRWVIVPASLVLTVALLLEIGHFHPSNVQAYTLVAGVYLLLLGMLGLRKSRLVGQLADAAPYIEAAGAAVIMFPSFTQSLGGAWRYELVLVSEAALFFTGGVVLRRRGVLGASLLFLVLIAGRALFDAANALPNWIVVMTAGMALLALGMAVLAGRERWDAWQRALLAWWQEGGNGHVTP